MKTKSTGRTGIALGVAALLIVVFSLASSLARRIGAVEPRVRIERGEAGTEAAQNAVLTRAQSVQRTMSGEVAVTAERLREASDLALCAGLLAIRGGQTETSLIREIRERNLLPAGARLTDKANVLATPYGTLVLHFRPSPLEIEALSIGRDKAAGPALIVRIAGDLSGAEGARIWSSIRLDEIQLPRPFAPEAEVIAAGWQAESLPVRQ
jgi:hypothetical protein